MLDTLKTLCAIPGVSGDEAAVRDYIRSRAEPHARSVIEDAMGNLIVVSKGEKPASKSVLLCAHMDEVGVIATGVTDDGYVKFACAGGIDRRVLFGKSVYFGENRVFGIIGNKAIHLVPRDERDKMPKIDDMYIDISASDRESALSLVAPGDTGAFGGAVLEFGDGYLRAKAIDDRLGCAVLLKILESDKYDGVTFAFTVQEEVGTRGAAVAAYRVSPEVAIVVESTTAADLPGVSQGKRVCEVGGGAVVPFMDGGTMYDRQLYDRVTRLATAQNISWQTKTYISGGTDAAAIQRSRGGVKTIAIAAPVRNLHSPACVGKISDFEAVHALASAFVGELCDE